VPLTHYPYNLFSTLYYGKRTQETLHAPTVGILVCAQCHATTGDDEPLTGPMDESIRARIVRIDESPLHITHLRSTTRDPGKYRGGGVHSRGADEGGSEGAGEHDVAGEHGEAPSGAEAGEHEGGGLLAALSPSHGELPTWAADVITCMDCHGAPSNRAHRFEASRENCLQCHQDLTVISEKYDHISCAECHFWGFAGKPRDQITHPGEANNTPAAPEGEGSHGG